jgi:hypothetical protein
LVQGHDLTEYCVIVFLGRPIVKRHCVAHLMTPAFRGTHLSSAAPRAVAEFFGEELRLLPGSKAAGVAAKARGAAVSLYAAAWLAVGLAGYAALISIFGLGFGILGFWLRATLWRLRP